MDHVAPTLFVVNFEQTLFDLHLRSKTSSLYFLTISSLRSCPLTKLFAKFEFYKQFKPFEMSLDSTITLTQLKSYLDNIFRCANDNSTMSIVSHRVTYIGHTSLVEDNENDH